MNNEINEAKEREAFEAYCLSKANTPAEALVIRDNLQRESCGHYMHSAAFLTWDAWLARAKLGAAP